MILVLSGCNQNGGGLSGAGGSFGNLLSGRSSPYAITYTFGNNVYVSTDASGIYGWLANPSGGTCQSLSLTDNTGATGNPGKPLNQIFVSPGDTCDLYIGSINLTNTSVAGFAAVGGVTTGNTGMPIGFYTASGGVKFTSSLLSSPTTKYVAATGSYFYVNAKVSPNGTLWPGYGPLTNPMTVDVYVGDNLSAVSAAINLSYGSTAITGIASANSIPPPTYCVLTAGSACDTTGNAPIANYYRSANNLIITEELNLTGFGYAPDSTYVPVGTPFMPYFNSSACNTTACPGEEFKIVFASAASGLTTSPVGTYCGSLSSKIVTTTGCTFAQIDTVWNSVSGAAGVGTLISSTLLNSGTQTPYYLTASGAGGIGLNLKIRFNASIVDGTDSYKRMNNVSSYSVKDFSLGLGQSVPIPIAACSTNAAQNAAQVRLLIIKHTDSSGIGYNPTATGYVYTNLPSYTVIGFPFCY